MEIKTAQNGNTVTIELAGDFDTSARSAFQSIFKDKPKNTIYVLDFAKVETIDSSGIGMLLLMREHAGFADANITIIHCNPIVRKTFQVAQMALLFRFPE